MHKRIILILALLSCTPGRSQSLTWAKFIEATSYMSAARSGMDEDGNFYITGYFFGTADFDPDTGASNLAAVSGTPGYLARYDRNGKYCWAYAMPGALYGAGMGGGQSAGAGFLLSARKGALLLAGQFKDSVDADFKAGVSKLYAASKGASAFLAKYDTSANLVWAKPLQTQGTYSAYCSVLSVAGDASDNIYICGTFKDSVDLDPGPGLAIVYKPVKTDLFFAKYDPAGNFLWGKQLGGPYDDVATDLVADAAGNVTIAGLYTSTGVDFDPGPASDTLHNENPTVPCSFFAKYDSAGAYLYAKTLANTASNATINIERDALDNIYLCGTFFLSGDFDPGPDTVIVLANNSTFENIFFGKYDANGGYRWAHCLGGSSIDRVHQLSLDDKLNIYLMGELQSDTVDFDPGVGMANYYTTSNFYPEPFFARYDSGGNYLSAGVVHNSAGGNYGIGAHPIDTNDFIITTMIQGNNIDFDVDPAAVYYLSCTSGGVAFARYSLAWGPISVAEERRGEVLVFPNPSRDDFSVRAAEVIERVALYDAMGRQVEKKEVGSLGCTIERGARPAGIYLLRVDLGEKRSALVKLVFE
jgi:hypothetical protein